jgi:tetratricopeptide (TPR) repeat protein
VAGTVVVCDLADAAHVRERAGPDVLRAVVSRFSRDMRAVLERHGGAMGDAPGDAVLASFADAPTALKAALAMEAARDALNDELQSDWGVRLSTRIGIGSDRNLAIRLEQTATFGQVWVDQATAEVTEAAAEYESADRVRVSGKGEAVRAWRLVRLREDPEPEETADPEEIAVTEGGEVAQLERALAGEGIRVVSVVGPAGSGKTRLLDALAERVGDAVLRLRCLPYDERRNPFDRFLDDRPLLPEERAAAVHEALAREARTVLVDDAHLGNETFLDLLGHLTRLPAEKPLLVVCASREPLGAGAPAIELEPRDTPPPLAGLRPEQRDALGRAAVQGDLPEELRQLSQLAMREAAYEALPKLLRADLHERAGGPDHLELAYRLRRELAVNGRLIARLKKRAAAALTEAGRRAYARGDHAAAVERLWRAEAITPESDPERLVLLGEAFVELGDLEAADEVLAEIDEPRAELARAYAASFTHGPDELREVAERVVEEVEDDDATLARAWHASAMVHEGACRWGAVEGMRRKQLEHARKAGERALELRALSGLAYALYFGPTPVEEAIEAVEDDVLPGVRGFAVAEALVLGALGGLESMRGRFDEARELHAEARDLLAKLGPSLPAAEAALSAAETELAAGDPEQAELLLRGAHTALEASGETATRASVAAALARALAERERDDEALALTEESERIAAANDVHAQLTWRAVRSTVLRRRDDGDEADRLADEAVALARETDDRQLEAFVLNGALSRSAGP